MKIKHILFTLFLFTNVLLIAQKQSKTINVFNLDSTKANNLTAVLISNNGSINFQEFNHQISIDSESEIQKAYFFDQNMSFISYTPERYKSIENVFILNAKNIKEEILDISNNENLESIGLLDTLSADYKILEIKVLKGNKPKRSGFNVQTVNKSQAYVDEKTVKDKFIFKESEQAQTSKVESVYKNSRIYYESNSTQLSTETKYKLIQIAAILINENIVKLRIEANTITDREGKNRLNDAERRVENVISFLMAKGVQFSQLQAVIKEVSDLDTNLKDTEPQQKAKKEVKLSLVY